MGSRCLIWKFFGFWFPHRSKPAALGENLTQKCQAMFAWRLPVCGSKIDHNQSIHQIRAGNLTKFNEYFTISRILIVFLASIAKLCKTEPPKSLPLLLKGAQLRLSLKVIEGHGGLGTRLNFDTSREEQLGRNVTLTKAPAYIGESPGKEIDFS